MFKGDFSFCVSNISYKRHSNLPWLAFSYKRHSNLPLHFLKTVMFSVRSLGIVPCFYMSKHGTIPRDLTENNTVLRKCKGKFECLLYEMVFIQKEKPPLNIQSDSLRANLFM